MSSLQAAWTVLCQTAKDAVAAGFDKASAEKLSNAARSYAAAAGGGGAKPSGQRSGKLIPFGRSKGVAIEDAETKDLQWVAQALAASIEDPEKERWRNSNIELRDAIEQELESR